MSLEEILDKSADKIVRNFDRATYKKDWVKSVIKSAIEQARLNGWIYEQKSFKTKEKE